MVLLLLLFGMLGHAIPKSVNFQETLQMTLDCSHILEIAVALNFL